MQNRPSSNKQLRDRRRSQRGFTLLEVLLAVIILGLSITAILQQFSVALRAGGTSRDVSRAVLYAREKLEELKMAQDLPAASGSGTFEDGYTWETRVMPYSIPEPEGEQVTEQLKHEILQLTARVTWQYGTQEKLVELTTLKMVKKKQWEES